MITEFHNFENGFEMIFPNLGKIPQKQGGVVASADSP